MKRSCMRLIALLVVFLTGVQAQSKKETIWGTIKSSLPQVSSPLAEQAGFYRHNFVVSNGAPFYCLLFADNKKLGVLTPGTVAYDDRHWQNMPRQEISVAALCYDDETLKNYIGATGGIISLNSYGYGQAIQWNIESSAIRRPDGSWFNKYALPQPTTTQNPEGVRIELPKVWWNSSLRLQVVNNTMFTAKIFLDGRPKATIQTSGITHHTAALISSYSGGRQLNLTVVFEDRGRLVGTYSEQLWVPTNDVRAQQIILGPEHLRRY